MEKKLGGLPMIVFTAACALAGFLLRTAQRGGGSPAALIAVSAAAHLAAGKGIITRADLDGPSLCSIDPYTGGPVYEGAVIRMNDNDGIGITGVPAFEP